MVIITVSSLNSGKRRDDHSLRVGDGALFPVCSALLAAHDRPL